MNDINILQNHRKEFWPLFFLACLLMFGFAFYQGTTVLYLVDKFKAATNISYEVNGVFSAVVYLCSVSSGYLTQKFIKPKQGLIIGLVMYGIGTILTSVDSFNLYLLGLTVFAVGYGFIYTNTFFLLGKIYEISDPRREGCFTVAYMGFNLGAVLGFFCGGIALEYHVYSMVIGLIGIVFIGFSFLLSPLLKDIKTLSEDNNLYNKFLFPLTIIILISVLWSLIKFSHHVQYFLFVICLALLLSIFALAFKERKLNPTASKKLFALGLLTFITVIYWTIYKMQDNLLLNFFAHHVDRHLFSFTIPATSLLSIDPFIILMFSPLVGLFWLKTGKKFNSPKNKVFFGLFILSLSFIFLVAGVKGSMPTPLIYAVLFLVMVSLSEIILGPGTISMVGQLADEKYHIILLGITQLSMSLASVFSGQMSVFLHNHFLLNMAHLQDGFIKTFVLLGGVLLVGAFGVLIIRQKIFGNKSELAL